MSDRAAIVTGASRGIGHALAQTLGEEGYGLTLTARKPDTLERAMVTQAQGEDLVVGYETRYGTGFQLTFPSRPFAGEGAVGHYGMGGSVAVAHPERGLAFGYVMNQMLSPSGPDPRSTALIQAVLRCTG